MADKFDKHADNVMAPARQTWLVVPGNNEIDPLPKGLRADTDGVLIYRAVDSLVDVTMNVAAKERIDARALIVRGGTTAVIHAFA